MFIRSICRVARGVKLKSLSLIKAFASIWQQDDTLRNYKITSTRVPQQTAQNTSSAFPYALIKSEFKPGSRKFDSNNQISKYLVTIIFYGGPVGATSTALCSSIADAMDDAFNFGLGLPILNRCYLMSIIPTEEDPELDADDYYGADVRHIAMQWEILLNEYRVNISN